MRHFRVTIRRQAELTIEEYVEASNHEEDADFVRDISNNSLPPLMVTMTPWGSMVPRSKGMYLLQRYIEFLHKLSSAFPPPSPLYNIYIYRHEIR